MAGMKIPQAHSERKQALTVQQMERFANAIDSHYRAFVLVLAYGGLRPGEACALRRRHLDDLGRLLIERGLVEVKGKLIEGDTKTHKPRLITLPATIVGVVKEHIGADGDGDPEAFIFTTPSGTRIRMSNFRRKVWTKAREKADLPDSVTPYNLRHSTASLLAQSGIPPHTSAAMLGNDPAVFLRTYAHLYPDDLSDAAAALGSVRSEEARSAIDPNAKATAS
jgi:integrase